ncbi:MAG: hypothetical protein ACOH2M_24280 [Cypionkella sp.]
MTIILPRLPRGAGYALRFVRGSETQRSATGGALSPLNRATDHLAIEVDPGVLATCCGRELFVDIARGVGERIRVPVPEPGVDKGAPGSPRVNGADQAGTSLILDGLTPQYVIRKGWFFTLITAAGPTAHMVAAEVTADADGEATVTFWPALWREPADNDAVEISEPYIEGLIVDDGDQTSGSIAAVMTDSFVVEEG